MWNIDVHVGECSCSYYPTQTIVDSSLNRTTNWNLNKTTKRNLSMGPWNPTTLIACYCTIAIADCVLLLLLLLLLALASGYLLLFSTAVVSSVASYRRRFSAGRQHTSSQHAAPSPPTYSHTNNRLRQQRPKHFQHPLATSFAAQASPGPILATAAHKASARRQPGSCSPAG